MYVSVALDVYEVKAGGINALNTNLCLFCFKGLGRMHLISLDFTAPFLEADLAVDFIPKLCKTEPPAVTGKHDSSEGVAWTVSQQCCVCGQKTSLCEAVLCLWTVRSSTLQLELALSDTISISQGRHCPPSLFRAISLGNLGSWDLSLKASFKETEIIWIGGYSWMTG